MTVGSALGQISDLFAKVKSINAKHGKFDLVLCLGDFFGPVREGEGELNADGLALLEGKLEGAPCLESHCSQFLMFGRHSSVAVLCHGWRAPHTSAGSRQVR